MNFKLKFSPGVRARCSFLAGMLFVFSLSVSASPHKEQIKLVAKEGVDNDFFGYSVALSGDTTVIGAFRVDDERGNDVGAAYVYTREATGWKLQAKLTADDGAPGDTFGGQSTIEGDTVVIGVMRTDDATKGEDTGSAYVFTRSGTEWTQQAKLTANDSANGDSLGWSIGISGNIIVVGAPRDDDKGKDSGSAYVFSRSGNIWKQTAKLTADDGSEGDLFGISAAISGDTILVGADLNEEKGFNAGAAYVFIRSGDSWKQQAKLTADDGAEGDIFGVRVALEDNTALISARRDDHQDMGVDTGSVYVFTRSSTVWSQQAKLTAPDGKADDRFGRSVALSGETVLIGAMFQDSKGDNAGAAYVYSRTGTTWKFNTKLTASDGAPGDVFGWAVALVGDTAVVTANRDDDKGENAGSAYIFDMAKK
ncbi:MAG: hypothetical protein COA74_09275 [Gammaproteobacteria bacterium]|nr:MAG: hypothetical protein COA74_09275 [Gammaproteobacteria bacterium]